MKSEAPTTRFGYWAPIAWLKCNNVQRAVKERVLSLCPDVRIWGYTRLPTGAHQSGFVTVPRRQRPKHINPSIKAVIALQTSGIFEIFPTYWVLLVPKQLSKRAKLNEKSLTSASPRTKVPYCCKTRKTLIPFDFWHCVPFLLACLVEWMVTSVTVEWTSFLNFSVKKISPSRTTIY